MWHFDGGFYPYEAFSITSMKFDDVTNANTHWERINEKDGSTLKAL